LLAGLICWSQAMSPTADLYRDPEPPVAMFSGPGHRDTLWSDVRGDVARSRQITWEGGVAATHAIGKVAGDAEVRTRSLELHFSWNGGRAEADAQSGKHLRSYGNRPRFGLMLPPETGVEFRIQEKSNYRFLAMEFEPHYVLRVAELQHLCGVELVEAWDYNHPLTWRLAEVVYDECEGEARQGLLYAETAIAFLALHVVRTLSNVAAPVRVLQRGGLAPAVLSRACEYMVSRLDADVSLSEVAGVANLSLAHFSSAFKRSMGISPHAWFRRQRVGQAKALLPNRDLSLSQIARAVGFGNQSAFGAAFKKETGGSPGAWRRMRSS
jgi:AraC family transcriptional regulator